MTHSQIVDREARVERLLLLSWRVVALIGGCILAVLGAWLSYKDPLGVGRFFHAGTFAEVGPAPVYRRFADAYVHSAYVGVALAGVLAFALFVWDRRPRRLVSPALFEVLLFVTFSLSFLNYASIDTFAPWSQQVAIDCLLVLLGSACVLLLLRMKTESRSAAALKAVVIGLLFLETIATPGIYATLRVVDAQGLIAVAQAHAWNPGWISIVAAAGSLGVGVVAHGRAE
jgi:hypothetical protein